LNLKHLCYYKNQSIIAIYYIRFIGNKFFHDINVLFIEIEPLRDWSEGEIINQLTIYITMIIYSPIPTVNPLINIIHTNKSEPLPWGRHARAEGSNPHIQLQILLSTIGGDHKFATYFLKTHSCKRTTKMCS